MTTLEVIARQRDSILYESTLDAKEDCRIHEVSKIAESSDNIIHTAQVSHESERVHEERLISLSAKMRHKQVCSDPAIFINPSNDLIRAQAQGSDPYINTNLQAGTTDTYGLSSSNDHLVDSASSPYIITSNPG